MKNPSWTRQDIQERMGHWIHSLSPEEVDEILQGAPSSLDRIIQTALQELTRVMWPDCSAYSLPQRVVETLLVSAVEAQDASGKHTT
ncbi:MAG: hypothetical protein IPM37_19295 [Hahellaceae bacterium]|nr:hypothetical protein [Hahellaceae bacterium]